MPLFKNKNLFQHKDDPLFAEFLESHGKAASLLAKVESEESESESEHAQESENEEEEDDDEEEEEEVKNVKTANKNISDLEVSNCVIPLRLLLCVLLYV
jgi:uncharacterized membrane protein